MTNRPDWLLLSRFRLHAPALADLTVATFDFVWQPALTTFLTRLARERAAVIQNDEQPPLRRLNDALVTFSPRLVHGFEYVGGDDGKPLRQILARMSDTPEALPTPAQLRHVVVIWALHWAQTRFATFFAGVGKGLGLIEQLQHDLTTINGTWHYHNAATLWANPDDELRYRAIPSLLAAVMHGRDGTIGTYDVHWQLCQGRGRQLMIVSTPQDSLFTQRDGTATSGTFAYAISFAVQTQAGSQEPWIHLYASCRRYPEARMKQVNYRRDVTVLVGTGSPRLQAWGWNPRWYGSAFARAARLKPLNGPIASPSY